MEKIKNKSIEEYLTKYKMDIRNKMTELKFTDDEKKNKLLEFIRLRPINNKKGRIKKTIEIDDSILLPINLCDKINDVKEEDMIAGQCVNQRFISNIPSIILYDIVIEFLQ